MRHEEKQPAEQNSAGSVAQNDKAAAPSRRQFLRQSSAVVIVTSVAAQPVWGACTPSGAVSNGSHFVDDDCIIDQPGRSPGYWKEGMYNDGALFSVFYLWKGQGNPKSSHNQKIAAALRALIDGVKAANTFIIRECPVAGMEQPVNVGAALDDPGGLAFNLAGVYLSAYFDVLDGLPPGVDGMSGGTSREDKAQAWVDHVLAVSIREGGFPERIWSGEPSSSFAP